MDDGQILHIDALGDFSVLIHCGWFDLVWIICSSIQSHMQHWTCQLQITIYIL